MNTEAYLKKTYGQPPDNMYYAGDMQAIARYHRSRGQSGFSLDDVTWNDLSMDDVFKRINCALTTPGEQLLYHMLRRPAMDEGEYRRRSRLIWLAEDDKRRLGMQRILYKLGKSKSANLLEAFMPSGSLPAVLILCYLLVLGFFGLVLAFVLGYTTALPAIISAIVNASFHSVFMALMQQKVSTANYLVAIVSACLKLEKVADEDIYADTPLLITGSNASGKSTFIKAMAVNAILAQSIATATCSSYAASSFMVYSSMALSDNLLEGQSYFVVEINTLKRIMDAMQSGGRVMCVVDEILRGTNTVERIAASSASLQHMAGLGGFCIAATHDIELCSLLADGFGMYHFTERVEDGEVKFDYKLHPGPSTSRNALKLLLASGFDSGLVAIANDRADTFLSTGRWEV